VANLSDGELTAAATFTDQDGNRASASNGVEKLNHAPTLDLDANNSHNTVVNQSIFGLFKTGVDANNNILTAGVSDPHYDVVSKPTDSTLTDSVATHTSWTSADTNTASQSAWIGNTSTQPTGEYQYSTTFTLQEGADPKSAVIDFDLSADNYLKDILVNGVSTGISYVLNDGRTYTKLTHIQLTDATASFKSGVNTITFVVENRDLGSPSTSGPSGIRIDNITGTVDVIVSDNVNHLADYAAIYVEGNPVSIVDTDVQISDQDGDLITGATVTLTNAQPKDLLIAEGLPSGINVTVSGNVVTLSGAATATVYQQALQMIKFSNSSETPDTSVDRTITVTVTDGANNSNTASSTIRVVTADDAPVFDPDANNSHGNQFTTNYTENGSGIAIVDTDADISDVDSAYLYSATIQITNIQAGDVLSVSGLPSGLQVSIYDPVKGVLIISGKASLEDYENALKLIKFSSTSENPSEVQRDITITVNDGHSSSAVSHSYVNVTATNDAPTSSNTTVTIEEDLHNTNAVYTFKTSDFGNYHDDTGTAPSIVITSLPTNGTLYLDGQAISAANTTVKLADINDGKLTFDPVNNSDVDSSINFKVSDGISTNNDTTYTTTIAITPVADIPTLSVVVSHYTANAVLTDQIQLNVGNPSSGYTPAIVSVNGSSLDTILLTPDVVSQRNSAMSTSEINLTSDFSLSFNLYFGTNNDGADGITFILQNDPNGSSAIGSNGEGLGAKGITNAVAIEFDTYQNTNELADDHTSVYTPQSGGTTFSTTATTSSSTTTRTTPFAVSNLEDGQWHAVTVNWNASSHVLSYTLNGTTYSTNLGDSYAAYFGGATSVNFGFTASTGAAHNVQEVQLTAFTGKLTDSSGNSISSAFGEHTYSLDVSAAVTDTDGSEDISKIIISGLPSGSTLSAGTQNSTTGEWTLTKAQLSSLTFTTPNSVTDSFSFKVKAVSQEGSDTTNIASTEITINVLSAHTSSLSSVAGAGLSGEYYGYNDVIETTVNGYHVSANDTNVGNIDSLQDANTIINGRTNADATFIATTFNYGEVNNSTKNQHPDLGWASGSNLSSTSLTTSNLYKFLNDGVSTTGDASTLKLNSYGRTTDAVIHISGSVYFTQGIYDFSVTADDGYSVYIDGKLAVLYDAVTSARTTYSASAGISLSEGLHDVEIVYWDQYGSASFDMNYKLNSSTTWLDFNSTNLLMLQEGVLSEIQDVIKDSSGNYVIRTGADFTGTSANDYVTGTDGKDHIRGGDGNDVISGGSGNDTLNGDSGNDTITGGLGADILTGGSGDDYLFGNAGNDTLTGGLGSDHFVWGDGEKGTSVSPVTDTITDFDKSSDVIDISDLLDHSGTSLEADLKKYLSIGSDSNSNVTIEIHASENGTNDVTNTIVLQGVHSSDFGAGATSTAILNTLIDSQHLLIDKH
jgi:hypothetical protein